jgi:L-amino acid N-acyltransferase YncA
VIEREQRLPSLLSNKKIGFSVLGTLFEQELFGFHLCHFVRINAQPFFKTDRYHILELHRAQHNTVTEFSDSICYRKANYETDFLDIVNTFPDELNRTNIAERVEKRFREEMPCFVARDKSTNEFIGAFWGDTKGYSFLEEYATQPVYWVSNLFVRSEFQGKGIAKQLLIFATHTLFQETSCEAVLSQIRLDRESSLRVHTQIGFQIIGEYRESHIGNYWFGNFKRITNSEAQ